MALIADEYFMSKMGVAEHGSKHDHGVIKISDDSYDASISSFQPPSPYAITQQTQQQQSLHPQTWSGARKHAVFFALIPGCVLTDFAITWGTTMFEAQARDLGMAPPAVARSVSGAIFMVQVVFLLFPWQSGSVVLFWSQLLTMLASLGTVYAPNYFWFSMFRALQGFFGAAPQVVGLSMIQDLFPSHERARKINIWAFSFLIGPYLGPFISGFVIQVWDWRSTYGLLSAFYGLSLLTVVLLGEETLCDEQADRRPNESRCKDRLKRLTGVSGFSAHGRPEAWQVTRDLFRVCILPYVLVPGLLFVTVQTMWTIGLVSTVNFFVKREPYFFTATTTALLFLAPMIGTILAEAWGHFFNDFIARRYTRRHNGHFEPEARLYGVYIPWLVGLGGLVLFGQALQHNLAWIALALGWGMNCFSTLGATTAISAYFLDVMPYQAAINSAWLNVVRTIGGFAVVYFQIGWVHGSGPGLTFGLQAVIVSVFICSILLTQYKGKDWRTRFPPPVTSSVLQRHAW